MAFDLATAKPVGQSGGFDLSTATPVNETKGPNAPNVLDRDAYLAAVQKRKEDGPGFFQPGGMLQNIGGAIPSGAGDIGSTLLSPIDAAARALNGGKPISIGGYDIAGQDRRTGIENALKMIGSDTDSTSFKLTKLGVQTAGTAGVGGAVANVIGRVAPSVAAAAPSVMQAIRTGGFSTGAPVASGVGAFLQNQGVRALGGGVNGLLSTGMVTGDLRETAKGGAISALLPAGVQAAQGSGKLIGKAVPAVISNAIGGLTGAGAETFKNAYRAGKQGGTDFLDNMRGNAGMSDVVDSVKNALANMRVERGNQYRSGMVDISKDKAIIDFAPIDQAVSSLQKMGSYKGQVINKNAAGTVDEISGVVNQWKGLDPAEFHTPEGLDALKKAIGDVRDATQFGSPGRKAADTAYNAVKDEINKQAPTYAKVMKDYGQASDELTQIEKAFSVNPKASVDTSLRKLQSLMRNNANTNYGNRLELAKTLESNGAEILPGLAGQAASTWTPRGLQALGATGIAGASTMAPGTAVMLPFMSPRLMGEAAYGLGVANRLPTVVGDFARQRAPQLSNQMQSIVNKLPNSNALLPLLTTAPAIYGSQR